MEPGCRYNYARCVSRTTERAIQRTNDRASALVRGRFGMLITDQHTYPSLAPPLVPQPLAVGYLGCQPIRLGTAPIAGLVARRARVRPTSRPYDPKRSFCPLSNSLLSQLDRGLAPLLLTASFAPPLISPVEG